MSDPITKKQLSLKLAELSQSELLLGIFNDIETVKFTNFKVYEDLESLNEFLIKFFSLNLKEPLQYGPYAIYNNNTIVGLCGLQQKDLTEGSAELWYILHENYWGRGIANQAVDLLFELSNSNTLLKFIYAEAVETNIASWKILEKHGFIRTGEIKQGFKKGEIIANLFQYVLKTNKTS